jgi:hypothetical protein
MRLETWAFRCGIRSDAYIFDSLPFSLLDSPISAPLRSPRVDLHTLYIPFSRMGSYSTPNEQEIVHVYAACRCIIIGNIYI